MNGILFINKSKGVTSTDSLNIIKKNINMKSIGHAGTLDPFATGLLIACTSQATKLLPYFQGLPKVYEATFQLGKTTDSFDCTGKIIQESEKIISEEELKEALITFKGKMKQIPPQFSALKMNGKRAYELARTGQLFTLEAREIVIHHLEMVAFHSDTQEVKLKIECSKGTYIRSIASDLGEKLKSGAYVSQLCRTHIGSYSLKQATLDKEITRKNILLVSEFFTDFPRFQVKNEALKRVLNGAVIEPHFLKVSEPSLRKDSYQPSFYTLYSEKKQFIAVVNNENHKPFFIDHQAMSFY